MSGFVYALLSLVWCCVTGANGTCANRAYEKACPEGWAHFFGDCIAPLSYMGPCKGVVSMSDLGTWSAKQQFANVCAAHWECAEACLHDYDAADCPVGWVGRGDGFCDAPLTYSGPCRGRELVGAEPELKQQFGLECGARWPCKQQCVSNFRLECPRGWSLVDGACVILRNAGQAYNGPCLPVADLQNFTDDLKQQFATRCGVDFCETAVPPGGCEIDMESLCPVGWLHVGSRVGYCLGHAYKGACRPAMPVAELSKIGRAAFAEKCGVVWPCTHGGAQTSGRGNPVGEEHVPVISGPVMEDGRVLVAPV